MPSLEDIAKAVRTSQEHDDECFKSAYDAGLVGGADEVAARQAYNDRKGQTIKENEENPANLNDWTRILRNYEPTFNEDNSISKGRTGCFAATGVATGIAIIATVNSPDLKDAIWNAAKYTAFVIGTTGIFAALAKPAHKVYTACRNKLSI